MFPGRLETETLEWGMQTFLVDLHGLAMDLRGEPLFDRCLPPQTKKSKTQKLNNNKNKNTTQTQI